MLSGKMEELKCTSDLHFTPDAPASCLRSVSSSFLSVYVFTLDADADAARLQSVKAHSHSRTSGFLQDAGCTTYKSSTKQVTQDGEQSSCRVTLLISWRSSFWLVYTSNLDTNFMLTPQHENKSLSSWQKCGNSCFPWQGREIIVSKVRKLSRLKASRTQSK